MPIPLDHAEWTTHIVEAIRARSAAEAGSSAEAADESSEIRNV